MQKMIKTLIIFFLLGFSFINNAKAQVKLEDIPFDINEILGKVKLLKVQKGFSPVFMLGNYQVNTVGILGEKLKGVKILGDIFGSKGIEDITKMYKTYKTGLVIYKVLSAAGTAVTIYSTVRGIANDFDNNTVKSSLISGLTSIATGVITKLLTKQASYKAVDIFNGAVKKKVKDILSIQPASSTLGVGLYVKL
jgi:hypothetical protein